MKRKVLISSVLAGLGLLAVSLLVALVIYLWSRPTRVEQLMEVLAAGDPGDAAWAFEKLKEVSHAELEELIPYLASTRPTPLEEMSATFEGQGSRAGFDGGIFFGSPGSELSNVAQFFLSTRLTGSIEVREPGPDLAPRWQRELENATPVPSPALGLQESWLGRRVFPPPMVAPPSMDPAMARLARDCDVEGLLAVLRSHQAPEVMWAVEVLKRAPDDRLDILVPHLAATENVAVRSLHGASPGQTCPDGRSLGAVARFLIWTRLGMRESELWRDEDSEQPKAPAIVRSAWLAHRGSNTGRAEVQSGLDEPYSEQVPEGE